jgi:hypothetical protein
MQCEDFCCEQINLIRIIKRKLKILLVTFCAIMLMNSMSILAQVPDPGDSGSGSPVGAPIDSGSVALLIVGAVIAVKKWRIRLEIP